MRREIVDFGHVPAAQLPIHWRLVNWERSLRSGSGSAVAPMFRQYRSSEVYSQAGGKLPIDEGDATKVGKAVQELPTPNLLAINWWYVKPTSPAKAAAGMQCSIADLARYVVEGREKLIAKMYCGLG
jgi:hypothetical protein